MTGMQDGDVQRLMGFIKVCKLNPKILHLPQLSFFREFIESFGGVIPEVTESNVDPDTDGKAENEPIPEQKEAEPEKEPVSEPEPMSSDESDVDIDREGILEPETEPYPEMGDNLKITSEDDEIAAGEKRSEAMSVLADDPNKAIELLTEAIKLNPASAAMYAKRANVLLKQNRVKAAMQDCSQAIELNLDYAPAYKFRGRANRLLGNWIEAAKDLRMACKLDFDEQADDWLKEVQGNANKLEEHNRRYERKREENEMEQRIRRAEKARKANEEAKKKSEHFEGSSAPNFMNDIFQDEELLKAFSDPEIGPALQDIMQNPANFAKYQNNPKIIGIMNKLMSKGMGGGMAGGFPGGMSGGFPGGMPDGFPSSGSDKTNDDLD